MSQLAIFQPATYFDWLRAHTSVFAPDLAPELPTGVTTLRDRRTYLLFFAVVILAGILFAARQPAQLLTPDLVAEDGAVFFADAYNQGLAATLLEPHGGYFNLIPRLIAWLGLLFPYAVTPVFYSAAALILTAVAAGWFVLPHYRHIVANDLLRVAFVALLLVNSNIEAPMLIAYVQWYVAPWCMLFAFMRFPRRAINQWILAFCYLLAILSAPVLIVLLPIWIVRLLHARKTERIWIGSILIVQTVVALATVVRVANDPQSAGGDQLVLDYVRAVSYKIGGLALLGQKLTLQTFQLFGWSALYLTLFIIMLSILAIWWRNRSSDRAVIGAQLIFIIAVSSLLYLPRASSFGLPFAHDRVAVFTHSPRYFLLSTAALYLFLLMYLDLWLSRKSSTWRYAVAAATIGLLLLGSSFSFSISPWDDASWPSYAALLAAIDQEAGAPSDRSLHVGIPSAPPGWCIGLYLPAARPDSTTFANDLTLVAVEPTLKARDEAEVDLVWTGDTRVPENPGEHVTAFVHLLDANHNRIAGEDVLLASESAPVCPDELFESQHAIPLPDDLAPGDYGLAVGLYYFQQDQIVPVGSITLDHALTIP